MPKKKVVYKYWELPPWDNTTVDVTRIFEHATSKGKMMMTLRVDDNVYVIPFPKRKEWELVTLYNKLKLTKISTQPKNAYLRIE